MSYFIYLPASSPAFSFCQEDLLNTIPYQNNVSCASFYHEENVLLTPPFSRPEINFVEFALDSDIKTQILSWTEQNEKEELETKDFKKRQNNSQKEVESAKKNSESNLINHFFSFFSNRDKSEKTVDGCIGSSIKMESHKEKLLHLFFNAIHVIKARTARKYVNKKILTALFDPEQILKIIPEIKQKIENINGITIHQLCEVFRKCCFCFFRTHSIDSILMSKRISCVAKQEHFRKRRKITSAFFNRE